MLSFQRRAENDFQIACKEGKDGVVLVRGLKCVLAYQFEFKNEKGTA